MSRNTATKADGVDEVHVSQLWRYPVKSFRARRSDGPYVRVEQVALLRGSLVVSVLQATTDDDLDATRALFREFVAWHRERHIEDVRLVDVYFDQSAFEAEVTGLPGSYAPPDGCLLLARVEGEAAGCVALRALGDGRCEMKRMFVYPRFHSQGVGRALGNAIVDGARTAGYAAIRLDTSVRQVEAQALYRSLGFQSIGPYYPLPPDVVDWLVFLELELSSEASP